MSPLGRLYVTVGRSNCNRCSSYDNSWSEITNFCSSILNFLNLLDIHSIGIRNCSIAGKRRHWPASEDMSLPLPYVDAILSYHIQCEVLLKICIA